MLKITIIAAALASAVLGVPGPALAETTPVKIAVIQDATGNAILEDYATQFYRGFDLALEYSTKGTSEIAGRKIEVVRLDTNVKPDRARALLADAYANGAVLAVGSTSSGVTKAMLPVAADAERILLVAPAVADSITGADWNRFIFKSSRNNAFDMQAWALALNVDKDTVIGVIGEDYAYVRDGVAALKNAVAKSGAKVVEEYVPMNATDLTPSLERLADRMDKEKAGRRLLFPYFGYVPNYMGKIAAWDPQRRKLELTSIALTLPTLETYKAVPGMLGSAFYYYQLPKNPINDWLVQAHLEKFKTPPDFFTVEGFTAGLAVVTTLGKAKSLDTETLISTMEGMNFDSPKGRMWFRKEDHQAMMTMYAIKIAVDPAVRWAVPELIREIRPEEFDIPIQNKR